MAGMTTNNPTKQVTSRANRLNVSNECPISDAVTDHMRQPIDPCHAPGDRSPVRPCHGRPSANTPTELEAPSEAPAGKMTLAAAGTMSPRASLLRSPRRGKKIPAENRRQHRWLAPDIFEAIRKATP